MDEGLLAELKEHELKELDKALKLMKDYRDNGKEYVEDLFDLATKHKVVRLEMLASLRRVYNTFVSSIS